MTDVPKLRTPNEGAWCICGGVFGSVSHCCVLCGRPSTSENTWRDPEPDLTNSEKARYEDGDW